MSKKTTAKEMQTICGTLLWMAPEMLREERYTKNVRTHIHSHMHIKIVSRIWLRANVQVTITINANYGDN
jgi:hypothetical protein